MTPPSERAGETRDRLLDATVRVGARAGWGGVTTRAVADEAGLTQGLVHYHFGSIDALRLEAVRRLLAGLMQRSMGRLDGATDPGSALVAMIGGVGEVGDEEDLTVFLYEASLAARRDESLRAELAGVLRRARAELAAWIRDVTADRPDPPDPEATALLVGAALDGVYIARLIDPAVDPVQLVGPVLRLLEGPGAAPGSGRHPDDHPHSDDAKDAPA